VTQTKASAGETRIVSLADIHVDEQFNPRGDVERADLDQLTASIARNGMLQPVLLAPNSDDGYRLIAGGRRFRAAQKARLAEVPAIVRETDSDTGGLELALIENIAREDLNPVEEALAFQRLMEAGLTRKGVAERLSIAQKRVTERLQILDVPEELHSRIASGEIPPGAIKALARLAKIHPALPFVAVAHLEHEVEGYGWEEPTTWADVADDPIAVVATAHTGERALPEGIYEGGGSYAVGRFALSDKAARDLAKYVELTGAEPETLELRFDREAIEQAEALGACHHSKTGYSVLIVGQEVADQLAGDCIARHLKAARKHQREMEKWTRRNADAGAQSGEPPSEEEEQKEGRQREREAAQEARRQATAYNHELGIACAKQLSRVRVDDCVVKVLACVNLHGELGKIAMRGARYGFPGWTEEVELKNGRRKIEYRGLAEATEAARSYLAGAKTAADVAGRAIALIAMARYADERAVARSQASFYSIDVYGSSGLPWSSEFVDLIDEICADRLPEHLTREQREQRAKEREAEAERARQTAERAQLLADALKRVDGLQPDARAELLSEVEDRLGDFSHAAWPLRQRIGELQRQDAADGAPAEGEEVTEQAA
jgi:ParB/RepB/Spo0J family partition protein